MRRIIAALVAIVALGACSSTTGPTSFAGGDCPDGAQRYTDGAGAYWCQLPNGSRFPTQ